MSLPWNLATAMKGGRVLVASSRSWQRLFASIDVFSVNSRCLAALEFLRSFTQNATNLRKRRDPQDSCRNTTLSGLCDHFTMSIEIAEKLKAQLTDKYVVVKHGVAELKRFESLTGVVKTVNMSGRALVQFDGPVDISWYDIDPQYLSVVDAPAKKAPADKHAGGKEATAKASPAPPAAPGGAKPAAAKAGMSPLEAARAQGAAGAAKPAAGKPAGMSPLEMARAQGAVGAAAPAAKTPPSAAPAPGAAPGGAKLSPLELARQQGAMNAGAAPAAKPAAAKAEAAPGPHAESAAQPAKKVSPLEIARMQGAAQGECLSTPAAAAAAPAVTPPAPAAAAPPASAPTPPPASGQKLSPLELARQQGAFKGNQG
jgi:hypothetical protein